MTHETNKEANQPKRLLVVTGLSGAGKSVVLNALEDFGFYCIDNLPIALFSGFVDYWKDADQAAYRKVAIGIDIRNLIEDLSRFPAILKGLEQQFVRPELLFIEASDETLIKRFSETRRRHPLRGEETAMHQVSLAEAMARERTLLEPLSDHADLRVDTSHMHLHELRKYIRDRVAQSNTGTLSLQLMSFGFKYGLPVDADFVFDVRCLPNPHWIQKLRALSGRDKEVSEFLRQSPLVVEMVDQLRAFLSTWVPRFEEDNRSYLTVAIGCTGGHHRSVYVVERLAECFRNEGKNVIITHRNIYI